MSNIRNFKLRDFPLIIYTLLKPWLSHVFYGLLLIYYFLVICLLPLGITCIEFAKVDQGMKNFTHQWKCLQDYFTQKEVFFLIQLWCNIYIPTITRIFRKAECNLPIYAANPSGKGLSLPHVQGLMEQPQFKIWMWSPWWRLQPINNIKESLLFVLSQKQTKMQILISTP